MKRILGVLLPLCALVVLLQMPAPAAQAKPAEVVLLTPPLCTALSTVFEGNPLACGNAANFDANVEITTDSLETDKDGKPQPHDLTGIDLDANQMHEEDGELLVAVLVTNDDPVRITIENGRIRDRNGTNRGGAWVCGQSGGTMLGDDPDCLSGGGGGFQNGLVVFSIVPDPNGERGPGLLTISQDRVPFDVPFTVTGEVRTLEFTNLQTILQVGSDAGSLNADGVSRCNPKALTDNIDSNDGDACRTLTTDDDCRLATNAAGFFAANDTPERTVSLVRAFDSDGTQMTGVFVHWQSDNPDIGTVATGLTPTIDLGSFGLGAPNIACGTDKSGTFTLNANSTATQNVLDGKGAVLDAAARERKVSSEFTVVGAPANVTLTAAPQPLDCNGLNAATVSAAVTDSAGTKAADGTKVNFDLQVLGTANPINAKTVDGVATTAVIPLSGVGRGVPVIATTGGGTPLLPLLQNSILVNCSPGAAPTGGTTPGGGTTTPGGGTSPGGGTRPTGTIRGPNTGTGFTEVDDRGSMPVTAAVALFIGAMLLVGMRYGLRRVD